MKVNLWMMNTNKFRGSFRHVHSFITSSLDYADYCDVSTGKQQLQLNSTLLVQLCLRTNLTF